MVLSREEHADAVAAFYREVWDPHATAEAVIAARRSGAASNVAHPGDVPPTAIVLQGDRVIGHCGTIAQRLWDGNEERAAYWVKGLMVLAEFRSGPVGYLVMKELATHLELSSILTVAPAARRLFSALGYSSLGALPNWVRPLRPGRMLRRLNLGALGMKTLPRWANAAVRVAQRPEVAATLGGGAGLLLRAGARISRLPAANIDTSFDGVAPIGDEIDALWEHARSGIRSGPVRDGQYLLRRYANEHDKARYQFVTARVGGSLLGLAVVRAPGGISDPRLGGIRVATISDIVFPPDARLVGLALLGAVERAAAVCDADAILCTSDHPRLVSLLKRQVYLRASANVHFFLRDRSGGSKWPQSLDAWWLARGDGHSDEVF